MAYLLDGAVILIFILFVWVGSRRGLVRSVLRLISCVVSLVLALLLSTVAAGGLFDAFLSESAQEIIAQHLPETDAASVASRGGGSASSAPWLCGKCADSWRLGISRGNRVFGSGCAGTITRDSGSGDHGTGDPPGGGGFDGICLFPAAVPSVYDPVRHIDRSNQPGLSASCAKAAQRSLGRGGGRGGRLAGDFCGGYPCCRLWFPLQGAMPR